jgi:hypothetical protein
MSFPSQKTVLESEGFKDCAIDDDEIRPQPRAAVPHKWRRFWTISLDTKANKW